jgi:hypothetical protein
LAIPTLDQDLRKALALGHRATERYLAMGVIATLQRKSLAAKERFVGALKKILSNSPRVMGI